VIGFFLIFAGRSEEEAVKLKATFEHLGLRRVMAVPAVTIPAALSVEDALREFFVPFGYQSFPVVDGDDVVGLLSLQQFAALPAPSRAKTTAGEAADRDPSLVVDERVTVEELSTRIGFRHYGRAIVVCRDGEVGILSSTAIERAMRASELLAETAWARGASPEADRRPLVSEDPPVRRPRVG
jgi:predicted transcriptional regulator